jgi:hypothetical protein
MSPGRIRIGYAGPTQETLMRLVKLDTPEGTIYINPEHVVAVVKGLRDTKVDTVSGVHVVKDSPEVVARLLGMEEIELDVTPRMINRS